MLLRHDGFLRQTSSDASALKASRGTSSSACLIKAAAGDSDWLLEIESFWADHIPIFMSVEGFYSYAAYCCAGENYGCYVSGSEPEFEEAKVVARDLSGFLAWVSHELNT